MAPSRNSMTMKALAIVLADVVNRADVGMVQGGSGLGFAAEALKGLRIVGDVFRKEFQRDKTAEAGVFGLIDHAHPATAELFTMR